MAEPEHLKIVEKGRKAWNKWRKKHPDERPDLCQANHEACCPQEERAPFTALRRVFGPQPSCHEEIYQRLCVAKSDRSF